MSTIPDLKALLDSLLAFQQDLAERIYIVNGHCPLLTAQAVSLDRTIVSLMIGHLLNKENGVSETDEAMPGSYVDGKIIGELEGRAVVRFAESRTTQLIPFTDFSSSGTSEFLWVNRRNAEPIYFGSPEAAALASVA